MEGGLRGGQRGVPHLLQQIKLDQLGTVGACTVRLMVPGAVHHAAAAPVPTVCHTAA